MIRPMAICLWGLIELFVLFSCAISDDLPVYFDYPPVVYEYNRLPEIEKECSPFLSSASELKPDDVRGYRIKKELSFFDGDWMQELGGSPLVPFDDSDIPGDSLSISSPLRLVGFEVKDVNPVHQFKNAVSICATMCIGIARNSTLLYDSRSNFYMAPGMSALKIDFEGIYIETKQNGGERLLCMLGRTTLPFSKSVDDRSDKLSIINSFSNRHHRLLEDNRLLLVLRYPQTFSLIKRAILGEMRSLNEPGKLRYFDVVRISSQLNRYSRYEFSEILNSKTCDLSSYKDVLEDDGANTFNNSELCPILRGLSRKVFNIVPNWGFISKGRLGPFLFGQEIKKIESSYQNMRLIMKNLICEQETSTRIMSNHARVAAVFRAFPAEMERDVAALSTGLSGMTLAVEGTWDASKRQLCMVGCTGVVDSGLQGCDSQISLYFPHFFSIKQRSIILGSISSISSESNSYVPILFELVMRPSDLSDIRDTRDQYIRSYLSYNYTKIELARAFKKRSQLSSLVTVIKPLFLSYPGKRSQLSRLVSDVKQIFLRYSALRQAKVDVLSHIEMDSLSSDLSTYCYGISVSSYHSHKPETYIRLEVLTLGPLFSRQYSWLQTDSHPVRDQVKMPKSDVLNISLSLMFTEEPPNFTEKYYKNISNLFLEGLYDPLTGEMHLIGCRKIVVQTRNLNIERGLDCLIEVKVVYPTETARWLINPRAELTITSQRNEDDSLYFHPIKLQTSMLPIDKYEQHAGFRKTFEAILRDLIIVAAIALISSQLLYMKENVDGIPYISRIMLTFQCLGYAYPLICNTKILLQEKEYEEPYNLYAYEEILTVLDYTGKLLAFAAFVLTVTLSRKVAEYRKRPRPCLPSMSQGFPGQDRRVLQITALILALGFLIHCHLYWTKNINAVGDAQLKKIWTYKQQEYIGFIQDLFLLPQVIQNMIWQTHSKPLRKLYYIGFTMTRLVLHLYDYVRDPIRNPSSIEAGTAFLNVNLFFTSRHTNLAFVLISTGLAILLHIQQERSHQKSIQQQKPVTAKSM